MPPLPPLSIKAFNYRCFADHDPLQLTLDDGPLALVGPNNAGKSTALKFFRELRSAWGTLRRPDSGLNTISPYALNQEHGVLDFAELFCNHTNGPIRLLLSTALQETDEIESAEVTITKGERPMVTCALIHADGTRINDQGIRLDGAGNVRGTNEVVIAKMTTLSTALRRTDSSLFLPAGRHLHPQSGPAPHGMHTGTQYIESWKGLLQSTTNKAAAKLPQQLRKIIGDMIGHRIDQIMPSTDGQTLLLIDGAENQYRLDELGSGITQLLVILLPIALVKPSLLLLDEPETSLHPALQRQLLSHIRSIHSGDLVFATHNYGLAQACASKVYLVDAPKGSASRMLQREAHNAPSEFLSAFGVQPLLDWGYRGLLLVEGETDVPAFEVLLKKLDLPDIIVFPCSPLLHTKYALMLAELYRCFEKRALVMDSEKDNPKLARERLEVARKLEQNGIPVHALECRATENLFSDKAVKDVFGSDAKALGDDGKPIPERIWKNNCRRLMERTPTDELATWPVAMFLKKHFSTVVP